MNRDETIQCLRADAARIHALGAVGLYLFGSAARDELGPGSDVDLFIDIDPTSDFSFVELIRLQKLIGGMLSRDVDLTTRDGLHPLLRAEIERASIRVL